MMKLPKTEGWKYAQDIISGKILASKWIIKACERAVDDYQASHSSQYNWTFNLNAANHIKSFCQFIPHVKGEKARTKEHFKLEGWQCFILEQVFGWRSKQNKYERRFRECLLEIARKNGKSYLCSVLALYELLFGDEGGEVYSIATKEDQAKIVWTSAVQISQKCDGKIANQLKSTTKSLFNHSKMSKYGFVGRDSKTLDGLNPSMNIFDEAAAILDRNVIDVMESATGARLNPLNIFITTAQFSKSTYYYEKRQYLKSILNGDIQDDRLFGALYCLEEDEDWTNPDLWIKANPNFGVSIRKDYLEEQVNQAKSMDGKKNGVLVKHFNIYTSSAAGWISSNYWSKCKGEVVREGQCHIGTDLAQTRDLCAVTRAWSNNGKFNLDFHCWIPEKTYRELPVHLLAIYRLARESGILTITPGDATDHNTIQQYIEKTCIDYNVVSISFDRYNAQQMMNNLEEQGLPIYQVNQGLAAMSPASKETERLIIENQFVHDDNPFIRWQLENCVRYEDINGNVKIRKPDDEPTAKVDSIVALIILMSSAAGTLEGPKDFNFTTIEL